MLERLPLVVHAEGGARFEDGTDCHVVTGGIGMYRLNEDQQRIVADATAVADTDLAPQAAPVDRGRGTFPKDNIAALGDTRPARPDDSPGIRRPGPGPADRGRGDRRRRAAVPLDRDGVPHAPVRRRLLRGRSRQGLAPASGGGRGAAPVDARVQRAGIAQPLLGAGQPRDARPATAPCSSRAQKSFVTSAGHADGYVVSTLAAGATHAGREHHLSRAQG